MELDVASLTLFEVLELPFRGPERVLHRDPDVGRRVMLLGVIRLTTDDKLLPRHDQLDKDVEDVPGSLLMVLKGDHHAAMHEPIVDLLELRHAFANVRLDGRGSVDIVEADLEGFLHARSKLLNVAVPDNQPVRKKLVPALAAPTRRSPVRCDCSSGGSATEKDTRRSKTV